MEYIEIIPHEGIGPLKLGMSSEEILFTLEQLHTIWSSEQNFDISKPTDIDCIRDIKTVHRLWIEQPFHPKLLSDESYINEMREVIDEMYQYLYFQIIAVKS